jgi:sugar phosphate isomerase/epimerase
MSTTATLAPLSLHRPASLDLVRAAAAAGYSGVGLQLARPGQALAPECTDGVLLAELGQALADLGLGVLEVSNVELTPELDPAFVARVVEVAAGLGARYVQATDWDPEPGRAAANLAALCERAADAGLGVAFEFMPYSCARSLEEARSLLAGVGRRESGLILDVLHFARSGGVPDQLDRLGDQVSFVQLCDARPVAPPRDGLRPEALTDRLPPGEGGLPLREILAALSPVPAISVEAPVRSLAGRPLDDQARILWSATTTFLEQGVQEGVFQLA